MTARITLLLIALLLLPAPGAAQEEENEPPPVPRGRLSISPFVGGRVPLIDGRRATLVVPGFFPVVVLFEEENGGGGVAGVEGELRLFGPVGVVGSFAFTNPDDILVLTETPSGVITQTEVSGPSVWFARAGISYRFPEPSPDRRTFRPAAWVSVGPALVREDYGDSPLGLVGVDDTVDSWALNLSVKVVQLLGSRNLGLYLAVEDYVTFWNPDDRERLRFQQFLDLQPGSVLSADLDYDRTHILMFNAGLSLRL